MFRLNTDERTKYPTFSSALLFVLNHCQWIWDKARAEHDRSGRKGPPKDPGTPKAGKRSADEAELDPDTPMSKSKKRRLREKALVDAAKKHGSPKPKAKAATAKGGSGKGGSSKNVAQEIFDYVKSHANGKCTFFNRGKCKFGDDCRDPHSCCDCGGPHSYVSARTPK